VQSGITHTWLAPEGVAFLTLGWVESGRLQAILKGMNRRPALVALLAPSALLALIVALAASASIEQAQGAFPGRNGKIAFEGKPLSIHTIRPDGSHKRRLTTNGLQPAFSANGKKIAFERRGDIWVMRANGSHKKRLIRNGYSPSFSPSGKKLVFARLVWEKRNDLYTIRRDGTHLKRLTHLRYVGESVFGPQFSPNGRSIVFTHGAQYKIAIIRSNGSHKRTLTDPPGQAHDLWPDFSPNGLRIVFQRGNRRAGAIYLMRRNGTHLRNIGIDGGRLGLNPAFSPSGKRIVFSTKPPASAWKLFTIKRDGSDQVGPLTNRDSQAPTWGVRP
jgi:Tol biopolymer transport system component